MSNRAFSVLGLFDSAQTLMEAIPAVKARVTGRLEAYTPYPSSWDGSRPSVCGNHRWAAWCSSWA